MRNSRRMGPLTGLLALALVGGGCELFDTSQPVDVNVFAAHHPRRGMDGTFPDYGFADSKRTWVNDLGWQINVFEGYIVITAAELISCDGARYPVEMPKGPFPEYLNSLDLDVKNLGALQVPEDTYCEVAVTYGPYDPSVAAAAPEGAHPLPTQSDLNGISIVLAGSAVKDDQVVDFTLISGASQSLTAKLREADGSPTEYEIVDGVGSFKVTIGKTYDRFFDGIDFATYDPQATSDTLMQILVDETRVYRGTTIF
ncbi:MAG: hypothetical protein R3A79_11715 [Nannocystaceae bacterium]